MTRKKATSPAFKPLTLKLNLAGQAIIAEMSRYAPEVREVLRRLETELNHYPKREIRQHEAAILYALARQYNKVGSVIFEIGTCWGYSAAVMSEAAPLAIVYTCTPNPNHVKLARANLARYAGRIEVVEARSVDLLPDPRLVNLSLVFVDGDHERVKDDMPWFNHLKTGGMMFHHDYTPPWSTIRPCRPVWDTLNGFSESLRAFDVLAVDEAGAGVAGWYRREGDSYEAA